MEAYLSMTGWVGGDIEFRDTSRMATASFRLASTPRLRRNGDWVDGETTWFTVTCFRSLAENVASSISKGDPVMVIGRVRTQVWDSQDGEHHERTVLEASTVGHDLTRGTAAFKKSERQVVAEDSGNEMGELITSAEKNALAATDPESKAA